MLTQNKEKVVNVHTNATTNLPYETALFDQLKNLRRKLAEAEGVPAYIVLSDATLVELSTYLPMHKTEFAQISGFGEIKLAKYGEAFCQVITDYGQQKNMNSLIHLKKVKPQRKEKSEKLNDTKQQTLELYKTGRTIAQIATQRDLSATTIETHLAFFVENGELSINEFVSPEKFATIGKVVRERGNKILSPIKEELGEGFSYVEIKMVIAHLNRRNEF